MLCFSTPGNPTPWTTEPGGPGPPPTWVMGTPRSRGASFSSHRLCSWGAGPAGSLSPGCCWPRESPGSEGPSLGEDAGEASRNLDWSLNLPYDFIYLFVNELVLFRELDSQLSIGEANAVSSMCLGGLGPTVIHSSPPPPPDLQWRKPKYIAASVTWARESTGRLAMSNNQTSPARFLRTPVDALWQIHLWASLFVDVKLWLRVQTWGWFSSWKNPCGRKRRRSWQQNTQCKKLLSHQQSALVVLLFGFVFLGRVKTYKSCWRSAFFRSDGCCWSHPRDWGQKQLTALPRQWRLAIPSTFPN